MVDYIIVGSGLAGIAFAETALSHGKTIRVFDNDSQNSSKIAAGLYNPVILKRFSKLQHAQTQLDELQQFYTALEIKLNTNVNFKLPILRRFFSVEEQNNWFAASDKPGLSEFLSTKLIATRYTGIDSPFDYGEVMQTGFVDTAMLVQLYRGLLSKNNLLETDAFDYNALLISEHVKYKDIEARHVIFAEGFGLKFNPYFRHLPLDGTKGELLIIKSPNLKLDAIINANVFILPLGNDLFKVGATYNWVDKTNEPTAEGKAELIEKIDEVINCDYQVISHQAGVRPTVKDRKPLIGTHPEFKQLHILNGLGTRGVMLAPAMAKDLFENIETGKSLDSTIDIKRFKKVQW